VVGVGKDKPYSKEIMQIRLRVSENEMPVLCRNKGQVVMTVSIWVMGSLGGTEVNVRQRVIREIGNAPGKDQSL